METNYISHSDQPHPWLLCLAWTLGISPGHWESRLDLRNLSLDIGNLGRTFAKMKISKRKNGISDSNNQKIYSVSYGNSLNQRASGTAYQKSSGRVTVNLRFSGSSELIIANLTYKNGVLQGSDTTGCSIRANKKR